MTQDIEYITFSVIGNFNGTIFGSGEKIDSAEIEKSGPSFVPDIFSALEEDMLSKAHAQGITDSPVVSYNIRRERDLDSIDTWKDSNNNTGACFFCGEITEYFHDISTPVCGECVNIYGTGDIIEKRKSLKG
jgi:hypothetical protein